MKAQSTISARRVAELERRVQALEARAQSPLWGWDGMHPSKADELVLRHGEYVDKTVAARILGVTRATVYAMLADGRISAACEGRRVDVRSIGRYMSRTSALGGAC